MPFPFTQFSSRVTRAAPEDPAGSSSPEPLAAPTEPVQTPEPGSDPALASGDDSSPGGSGDPTPQAPDPAPKPDWRDKRLAKVTAQLRATEAELAAAKSATPRAPGQTEAEFQAAVTAQAERVAAQREFNAQADAAALAGDALYGQTEFRSRVGNFSKIVDPKDPQELARYNQFVEAALATGEAPKIIYALGGDLDEAERIMGLPPVRQGIELARLAAKEPAPVSGAPKPITPITPKGVRHDEIDPTDPVRAEKLSTKEWMRRREAQVAAAGRR